MARMNWDQVLADLATEVGMYSARDIQALLRDKLGQAGIDQVGYLGAAGVFGTSYVSGGGGTYHEKKIVDSLMAKPNYRRSDLNSVPSLRPVGGALILRQLPLTRVDLEDTTRPFFGTHAALFDEESGPLRKAADDALRQYWRIAPARRSDIWQHIAEYGYCPLVVSVGKWCLGGRNIIGMSLPESGPGKGRVVFDLQDASEWVADLRHTWLDSGNGPAALWWSRDS